MSELFTTRVSTGESTIATLRSVERIYRRNIRIFVLILLPAVVFGYFVIIIASNRIAVFARSISHSTSPAWEFTAVFLLRFGSFLASWLVYCFAFGAIFYAVRDIRNQLQPTSEGSFAPVREALGRFLRLSSFLFLVCVIPVVAMMGLTAVFLSVLLERFGLGFSLSYYYAASLPLLLLTFGVLARWTLAVPVLLNEGTGVWAAMKRSNSLTDNRLLALTILIIEGFLGTFLAQQIPLRIVGALVGSNGLTEWQFYALYGFSLVCALFVQPIMFVGFANIYMDQIEAPEPATENQFFISSG
jgi:hypothetical protein